VSYQYSPEVTITVVSGLAIANVSLTPSKTTASVNEKINFTVKADFNRAAQPMDVDQFTGVELVLAVNTQTNIVSRLTVMFGTGATYVDGTLTYAFSSPGTYKVWGGARLIPKTGYVGYGYYLVSEPVDVVVYGEPEGYPSPGILGDLALFVLGMIAGGALVRKWPEIREEVRRRRIPRIVIGRGL